eukprot:COSAG04_NODE_302_length_17393_cov_6.251417_15_plen_615_part_00
MPRADAPLREVLVPSEAHPPESTDSATVVGLSRPASPSRGPGSDRPRPNGAESSASSPTSSAPRRRVLVADRPQLDPEQVSGTGRHCDRVLARLAAWAMPSEVHAQFGAGDRLLLALFSLAAVLLLGASLFPWVEVARAAECSPNRTCSYTEGLAIGHGAEPVVEHVVAVSEVDGREACCTACGQTKDCAKSTYFSNDHTNATTSSVNCVMFADPVPEATPLEGAALCSLNPDDVAAARGSLERQLETLLGFTAMLTRFGGFLFTIFLGTALEAVGYSGAGLVSSVLAPRQAGAAAAAIASAEREGQAAVVPEAAGWDAIGKWGKLLLLQSDVDAPSTWTEARVALGLSVRQAVWSCGSKLLLWHWAQPLSYFAVLGIYYCTLDDGQRGLGLQVAVREVLYVLSTLLALWLNPAYLLLELDPMLKPSAERCCWCCCRVDWQAAKRWGLYLLAPHHYVTLCLMRWAAGAGRGCVAKLLFLVGLLQFTADWCSAIALINLLTQPSPPTALAIGYWLTTAGLVAFAGGYALLLVGSEEFRRRVEFGGEGSWRLSAVLCCLRSVLAVGILGIGSLALLGLWLLVLAPLQLSGAVHGLAPPCDAWYCDPLDVLMDAMKG